MRKKIAIVTGASSGLGLEFTKQIDREFSIDDIWLIARREERLKEVAKKLKRTKGIILKIDLTKQNNLEKIFKKLKKEKPEIKLLVNNAGFGRKGKFFEIHLQEYIHMIDLNIKAVVALTYEGLKYMSKGSKIIQVSSLAGFTPWPNFNVYSATKAFVLNFANCLNKELKEKGIHTLAVCPGPINNYQKIASKALKDLKKNKWISIHGFQIKIIAIIIKLLPRKWFVKIAR